MAKGGRGFKERLVSSREKVEGARGPGELGLLPNYRDGQGEGGVEQGTSGTEVDKFEHVSINPVIF